MIHYTRKHSFFICRLYRSNLFALHISCLNTNGVMCFTVVVSDNTDFIQGRTAEKNSKEDLKETAILAVSSVVLAIYLIFLVCFCVAFRKCRMQKW